MAGNRKAWQQAVHRADALVVDDELMTHVHVSHWLRDLLRTDSVRTGDEALRLVEHARIAVFVIDTRLPDMTGFELTSQLRVHYATRGWEQPLIVGLSNRDWPEGVVQAEACGMDGHLFKPFRLTEFLAVAGAADRPIPGSAGPDVTPACPDLRPERCQQHPTRGAGRHRPRLLGA